jgi:hypothetical protein
MRKNRFDSDNPMDQFLFCFGSEEDTDDTGDSGGATRIDSSGNRVNFNLSEEDKRAAEESRAALDDFGISADLADMGAATYAGDLYSMAPGSGGDNQSFAAPEVLTSVRGEPEAGTRGISSALGREDITGPYGELTTGQFGSLTTGPYGGQVTDRFAGQRGPRFDEADIFAMPDVDLDEVPGGAVGVNIGTPASAQIQEARSAALGSPNDIRNAEMYDDYNFPGMAMKSQPDFDGGDVGDFYDFVSPEIQKQMDILAKEPPQKEGLEALIAPGAMAKRMIEGLTDRDKAFARQVNMPGNQFQTNAQGQITGIYNPKENAVYTPSSVGLFSLKDQKAAAGDLYDMQRAKQETQREDGGGDQQAAPAVTAPVAPATCPPGYRFNEKTNACEYVGQIYPGATPYSGQPITASTQYTGIGGLQPFVLQPTYTAQTPFQPLYRV